MKRERRGFEASQIKGLVKKGYSQAKIARTLHIRKQQVSSYMQSAGLGKRAPAKGAGEFWKDVKAYKRMHMVSHKVATIEVKHSRFWGGKRLMKMNENSLEYWKERYEIERRLTGGEKKRWQEEEEGVGASPK